MFSQAVEKGPSVGGEPKEPLNVPGLNEDRW